MKNFLAKYLLLAVSFLLLAILVFLGARVWYPKKEPTNNLAELIKTIGANRVTEGRLSGGFAYAPYIRLPKSEKKEPQEADLAEVKGSMLISPSEMPPKEEVLSGVEPAEPIAQSKSRGVQQINYLDNLLLNSNTNLSRGFPNIVENVLFRGDNGQEKKYGSSNVALKVADLNKFKRAAAAAMFADANESTAETSHVVGIANMFLGDFEEAISYLEKASIEAPNDAKILNDLAVAYLARGENNGQSYDLIEALETIDKSLKHNPTLNEARFNQALIVEHLHLIYSAKDYWKEYVGFEKDIYWIKEAKEHLSKINASTPLDIWKLEKQKFDDAISNNREEIAEKIVAQYPHFARMYVLDELLAEWANSYFENNLLNANSALSKTKFIGAQLVRLQGDKLIQDISLDIERISSNSSKEKLLDFSIAYQNYYEGIKNFEIRNFEIAKEDFSKAERVFQKFDHVGATALSVFQRARCYLAQNNLGDSLEIFDKLISISQKHSYFYLLGRVYWPAGIAHLYSTRISEAFSYEKKSLHYLTLTNDLESLSMVNLIISGIFEQLGETSNAWNYQYSAMSKIKQFLFSPWHNAIVSWGLDLLSKNDKLQSSLYFQQEISFSRVFKEKIDVITSSLLEQSLLFYRLGNSQKAFLKLEQAKEYARSVKDEKLFRFTKTQQFFLEAKYKMKEKPIESLTLFTKAIDYVYNEKKEYNYNLTELLFSRAQTHISLRNYISAEEDLKACIDELEKQRSQISEEAFRTSFFESPQTIYDEMVKFQIFQKGNTFLAFDYAETSRARGLLDILGKGKGRNSPNTELGILLDSNTKPYSLAKIQDSLPPWFTLIEYSVLGDCLIVWLVDRNKVNIVKIPINQDALETSIKAFRSALEKNREADINEFSFSIYKQIIEPIASFLPKADKLNEKANTIIFIPDKSLHNIPFSALKDSVTKRFLVEDYAIGISPSATIFVRCLQQDKKLIKQSNKSILAIGNPKFDRKKFPRLKYLPGAEEEAKYIATLYPLSEALIKEKATLPAFFELAKKHSTVHFAGHALVDSKSPLYSKLMFASDHESSGLLYAHALYNHKFVNTRLVILAACRTAIGYQVKGEGVASLTRPFLASGIPTVVASLWDADDYASSKLFISFHKYHFRGEDVFNALRLAQIELLNNSDLKLNSPSKWALFVSLGGSST